jgi:hypothetical protein
MVEHNVIGSLKREAVYRRGTGAPRLEDNLPLYVDEVDLQCEFAVRCFGEVKARVDAGSNDLSMLAFTHAMLVFAGNVSKLLFPSAARRQSAREIAERRGRLLRETLGIQATSILAERALRDHLEHFDERLDKRLLYHEGGIWLPRLIASSRPDRIRLDDGRECRARILRCFDTSRLAFSYLDREVELPPLATELTRAQAAAKAWLQARQLL